MRLGLAISPVLLLLALAAIAVVTPADGVADSDAGSDTMDGPTTVIRDWNVTVDTHISNGTWVLYDSLKVTGARLTVEDAVLILTRDDYWTFYFDTNFTSSVSMSRVTVLFNHTQTILTTNGAFELLDCILRPANDAPREVLLLNSNFGSMTLKNCTVMRTALYLRNDARLIDSSFNASMVWGMTHGIGTTFPYTLLVEGCSFTYCQRALLLEGSGGREVPVGVEVRNTTFEWCPNAVRVRDFINLGSVLLEDLMITNCEQGLYYVDSGTTVIARNIEVEASVGVRFEGDLSTDLVFSNTTLRTSGVGVRLQGVYDQQVVVSGLKIISEWDGMNASNMRLLVQDCSVQADRYDFVSSNASIHITRTTHGFTGLIAYGEGSIVHNRTMDITGTVWLNGPTITVGLIRILGGSGHQLGEFLVSYLGPTNVTYWLFNATVDAFNPTAEAVLFKDRVFFASLPFNVTDGASLQVEIVDDFIPRARISSPANDSIIAGWVLDVRGLLDERGSGMELIRARVDDGPWYYGTWDLRGRFNITLSSTIDGYHTIEVNAVDKVGNVGQTLLYRILTDGTPPFIEIVSPGNYARTTPVLLVGRTEQGASVSINSVPVEVDMTGSFELLLELPEGLASFLIEAVDVAGNTNSTTHSLEVDLTPPLFSIDTPSDGEWLGESPFLVSGSTEEEATVLINGEEAFRDGSSFNRSVDYGEGVHTLLVLVRDKAGNEVTTQLTVGVDLTPPEVVIDVPAEYETLTSTSPFRLSGVVLDENQARVFVNGVEAELTDGHWTSDVELERGFQVIDVKAEDVAGHQTFASRRVYYDPDPPRLTVVLILGEEELVDLQGTIRTAETSATLRLGLDEDALIHLGDTDPFEGARGINIVELVLVENDVTQVVVDAQDIVGNLAGEVSFIIEVDTLPPLLVVTEPLNGSVSKLQEVTIRGTSEPGASVRVNGLVVPLDGTGAFEANVTLEEGPNEIVITAEDDLGNSVVQTLAVDYMKEGPADPGGGLAYMFVVIVVIVLAVVAAVVWKRG